MTITIGALKRTPPIKCLCTCGHLLSRHCICNLTQVQADRLDLRWPVASCVAGCACTHFQPAKAPFLPTDVCSKCGHTYDCHVYAPHTHQASADTSPHEHYRYRRTATAWLAAAVHLRSRRL